MPRGIPQKKKPKKTGPKKEIKLTDITIKKLEEAFAIDCTVEDACFYAEISVQTYYNWISRHPDLKKRFEELQARPVLLARQTVVKKIPESYANAMDYLKKKRPKEFLDKQIIEHEGSIEIDHKAEARKRTQRFRERVSNLVGGAGKNTK